MDPSLICKIFFATGVIALGTMRTTSFRHKIMDYGSRSRYQAKSIQAQSSIGLLERIVSIRVPHSWFTHYYVASVISSLFWLYQMITHGSVLQFLASVSKFKGTTMTVDQVFLVWLLMTIQGIRRLLESIILIRQSHSQMWVGIWFIGILFYLVMGISIWIEGISQFDHPKAFGNFSSLISDLSLKTYTALLVFITTSALQNDCHRHLFSLQKYSLPTKWIFQWVICPHYMCECLIYLSITLISAPKDQLFNSTVFMGLLFVISNLAVTANGTLKWYKEKFDSGKVKAKWRMIPFLY